MKYYDAEGVLKSESAMEYGANCGSSHFDESKGFAPTKITSGTGIVTRIEYDALYRKVRESVNYATAADGNALESVTFVEYDIFGNVVKSTDPLGNSTFSEYNALDKPVKITNADSTVKMFSYTADGKTLSETDETGNTVRFEYDLAGRLSKKIFPTAYDFDIGGHAISSISYEYDANGNLVRETNGRGFNTDSVYDQRNRLVMSIKPALPDGNSQSGLYLRPVTTVKYDAVGNKLEETDANGNMKTGSGQTGDGGEHIFTYDAFNRLTHQLTYDVNVLSDTHYTYDDASNRIGKSYIGSGLYDYTKSPMTEEITYTVNSLNQTTGYTRIFNYENRGEEVTTKTMTYNAYGAMTSFGEDTYSYDGFGRLTEHRIGTKVRQYKYDYRNRLKEVWKDSYGGKISKATTPIYSGGLSVLDGSKLYRGVDMGGGVGGLLYEDRLNGDVSFKTSNIRGDIMTNINETRSTADGPNDTMTTEIIDYGTFGEGNRYNGNYYENYRANSKREDMGLINDGHRWRNANLNMFLVPDPLEYPDGLNTYIYCNQNPWTRFDPTGLAEQELRRRPVNNWFLGGFLNEGHSSRIIKFTAKEYEKVKNENGISDKILTNMEKNVAKDGSTHITASFFNSETEKNKNGKSFF